MNKKEKLKFIAISGTTGATENFYIYEYENTMIVVDCGVGFPDPEMYGVDLVIPDFSYVIANKHKLKGLIVTHGHEDHLGAIPFLLKEIKSIPIYTTKLTAGFIEEKFKDHGIQQKINVFSPEKDKLTLGDFTIDTFRVSHSVPDGVGLAIHTPQGTCFHVPDYKFDWTSVDGKPFDIQKAARIASKGVLMMASDALGSTTQGFTESEIVLEKKIHSIVSNASGRVFITTVSSNISRMQQIGNVAKKTGRKVVFVGRSIDSKSSIAEDLGYLHYPKGLVINPHQARKMKDNKLIYIIAGCYGQPGSALYRATMGEHRFLQIDEKDTVVFSADPAPPGSKVLVDFLVDRLFEIGVDVHYYDLQENLHVSGHGSMEDIKLLMGLVKPRYYIPIGGTVRHMHAYSKIAQSMGADKRQILELLPGSVVEFEDGKAKLGKKLRVKEVLVDGLGVGDVGNLVLRDRQKLSQDGFLIAVINVHKEESKIVGKPEFITRGFVFEKDQKEILEKAVNKLSKALSSNKVVKPHALRTKTVDVLEKFFYEELHRRPMIVPLVMEI